MTHGWFAALLQPLAEHLFRAKTGAHPLVCTPDLVAVGIKVLSAEAMKPALEELIPDFERVSGNVVTVDYVSTP